MKRQKSQVFLVNNDNDTILARNGKWYRMLNVLNFKLYSYPGNAHRAARRHGLRRYTLKYIYPGEEFNAVGQIFTADGMER